MKKHQFIIYLLFLITACSKPSHIEQALRIAGNNRGEIEKVMARYATDPKDSLKYKAACFLIENMPGYHCYEGKGLDDYSVYFKALGESKKTPSEILDSLRQVYGLFNLASLHLKHDLQEVDSAYLCENIDLAFDVWENKPWCKHIKFDDFCEFILPYRISNEKLTNWRREYMKDYASLLDSIKTDNPVEVARILRNKVLEKGNEGKFTTTRPNGYPGLDAYTAKHRNGSCLDIAQFALFLFRAAGIPCAIDFMPTLKGSNAPHFWVSTSDHKGDYYLMDYFADIEYTSEKSDLRNAPKLKVYRKTFSINRNEYRRLVKTSNSIPPAFSEMAYRFTDVTPLYSNYLTSFRIPHTMLTSDVKRNDIVFLCAPIFSNWVPVDWTQVGKKGDIVFDNVEAGTFARIAKYENGRFQHLSYPFKMHRQTRELEIFSRGTGDEQVVLYSKYTLAGEYLFRERMIGGVFEGCNHPDFKQPDTLHIIMDLPSRLFTRASVHTDKKYRYVRYKGGENSHCNVAEVRFFSDTLYLSGKTIGTPGCFQEDGSHEYTNVFDGLTETSFDHTTPNEGWTGLAFDTPQKITEIIYSPRNHDNYIKEGNLYELFVCEENEWKSYGKQIAVSDSLCYENIPSNALLYLKNHTAGKDERPFTYENGKQVWW